MKLISKEVRFRLFRLSYGKLSVSRKISLPRNLIQLTISIPAPLQRRWTSRAQEWLRHSLSSRRSSFRGQFHRTAERAFCFEVILSYSTAIWKPQAIRPCEIERGIIGKTIFLSHFRMALELEISKLLVIPASCPQRSRQPLPPFRRLHTLEDCQNRI